MVRRSADMKKGSINLIISGIIIILFGAMSSCSNRDDLIGSECTNRFFYVSSAVCSEFPNDAAVRDFNGREYIARDLFTFIDRVDVTVDQEYSATYQVILPAGSRTGCGVLIVAPVIEILCFQNPE